MGWRCRVVAAAAVCWGGGIAVWWRVTRTAQATFVLGLGGVCQSIALQLSLRPRYLGPAYGGRRADRGMADHTSAKTIGCTVRVVTRCALANAGRLALTGEGGVLCLEVLHHRRSSCSR